MSVDLTRVPEKGRSSSGGQERRAAKCIQLGRIMTRDNTANQKPREKKETVGERALVWVPEYRLGAGPKKKRTAKWKERGTVQKRPGRR